MSLGEFRTWDKRAKVMEQYYGIKLTPNRQIYSDGGLNITDNYIIIFFTGLKDSKGVKIFEGDLVKAQRRTNEDYQPILEVTFLNGCFMVGNCNAHEIYRLFTNLEVIGNIYENPELLGGE